MTTLQNFAYNLTTIPGFEISSLYIVSTIYNSTCEERSGVCTNFNFLLAAVTPFVFAAAGFAVLGSVITGELITTQKKKHLLLNVDHLIIVMVT